MRETSHYYKVYEYESYPYASVKALKQKMRENNINSITIMVEYRRRGSGRLDICKYETFKIRLPKRK